LHVEREQVAEPVATPADDAVGAGPGATEAAPLPERDGGVPVTAAPGRQTVLERKPHQALVPLHGRPRRSVAPESTRDQRAATAVRIASTSYGRSRMTAQSSAACAFTAGSSVISTNGVGSPAVRSALRTERPWMPGRRCSETIR